MAADYKLIIFLRDNKWQLLCFGLCILILGLTFRYNRLVEDYNLLAKEVNEYRNNDTRIYYFNMFNENKTNENNLFDIFYAKYLMKQRDFRVFPASYL